jgi:hypothetical protein
VGVEPGVQHVIVERQDADPVVPVGDGNMGDAQRGPRKGEADAETVAGRLALQGDAMDVTGVGWHEWFPRIGTFSACKAFQDMRDDALMI